MSPKDEHAFMTWFWRNELREYKLENPGATALPEASGASVERIDNNERAAKRRGARR